MTGKDETWDVALRCTRCNEPLNGRKVRWLEGDFRTGTYHRLGEVRPKDSQGAFPFGLGCARIELGEER
jgi:hypothetical protein